MVFIHEKIMLYKSFFIFSVLMLLWAPLAHAQLSSAPAPVQYTVSPETPGPNEKVYINLEGLGSFLGNSTITWFVDGKVLSTGVAKRTFLFTTGGVGSATHIQVTISTAGQSTITHDFYFAPSVIYLTWEADTSVPTFYKGKSLYTSGSPLKIVAIPFVVSGKMILAADKLSFQWSRGDTLVPDQSGVGKEVFSFTGDQLRPGEDIKLDVLFRGLKVGHAETTVPAASPQVLLYDRDPLRGEILEEALPSVFSLSVNEITLKAEPYLFSNKAVVAGKITYSWTLNNQDTTGPESARGLLTLRQKGQGAGSGIIGVTAQNTDDDAFVQTAKQALELTFGQTGGDAISTFLGL